MATVLPNLSIGQTAYSKSSKLKPKANIIKQKMGDGYTSVTPLGINTLTYELQLDWKLLKQTDFDTLWSWAKSTWQAGTPVQIYLRPINPNTSENAYFVITDVDFNTSDAGHLHNVSIKFEQVFNT